MLYFDHRLGFVFLALMLTAAPGAHSSDRVFPDSPLGHRVAAYFDAFNSGDVGKMKEFLQSNLTAESRARRPVAERLDFFNEMKQVDGKFLVMRAVLETDGSLTVFATNTNQEWRRFSFEAEPGGDRRLTGMRVEQIPPPSEHGGGPPPPPEPPKATDADAATATDALASELAARGEFSGTVLLARHGEAFLRKAYGFANREWNVPNGTDTKFNIGSMNKIFTTVAIAQLAAARKISLDDTIRKWLPDFSAPYADRVTVRQLVSMRSGMGDFFGPRFDATPASAIRALRDYLPFFEKEPLKFEPGMGEAYSNAGFIILGLIVEKASGEDYYEYVRAHIFEPAGMRATASYALDEIVPDRAEGYTRRGGGTMSTPPSLSRAIFSLPGRGSSAGGGYSTADDLLQFDRAFRSNRLLSPEWAAWVCSSKAADPGSADGSKRLTGGFGFAGGSPGTNAVMLMNFDTGTTIVVLSNLDPPAAESLEQRIRAWLPR